MRLFFHAISVVAVTFASGPAHAQFMSAAPPRTTDLFTFSISVFGAAPMGEFRQHENGGGGADAALGFQPFRNGPLVVRAQVAGMMYDGARASGLQDVCDQEGACWTERVTYQARNHSMVTLHGGPELMATKGTWRPFGYALAGWTFFRSWANVQPETPTGPDPGSDQLFSSRNFSSVYGAGVRRVRRTVGRQTGFELSARFVRNADAAYLTERGITRHPDGSYAVNPRNGAANVLAFHFGFWIGPRVNR